MSFLLQDGKPCAARLALLADSPGHRVAAALRDIQADIAHRHAITSGNNRDLLERDFVEHDLRGRLAEGLFRMRLHGQIHETYAIDVSPHLNFPKPFPWQEVARVTNVLGAVEYEDPYVPNVPQRFYRARTVE